MKYADYNIDNNKLEIYNSLTGIEIIKLNKKIVSKGFSMFGRNHFFKIGEDQYILRPFITLKNFTGIVFSIFKNGKKVQLENLITKADKRKLVLQSVLSIILGLIIGAGVAMGVIKVMDTLFNMLPL